MGRTTLLMSSIPLLTLRQGHLGSRKASILLSSEKDKAENQQRRSSRRARTFELYQQSTQLRNYHLRMQVRWMELNPPSPLAYNLDCDGCVSYLISQPATTRLDYPRGRIKAPTSFNEVLRQEEHCPWSPLTIFRLRAALACQYALQEFILHRIGRPLEG